jgi:hypothetical protein
MDELAADEKRKRHLARLTMTPLDRLLDEKIEQAYFNSIGRLLHRVLYGYFYAPAGGPHARVGRVKPSLCTCESRT